MKSIRLVLLVALAFLTAVAGCGGKKEHDNGKKRFTSATIAAGFGSVAGSPSMRFTAAFNGTAADVASMTVDVKDGSEFIAEGTALAKTDGVWSATIDHLLVGSSLTFVGHAYDGSGQEIFTGTTVQTLDETDNLVVIVMAPVSSGETQLFPRITQISRPAEVLSASTVTIALSVQGSSGEALTYSITAADGGGSFDPAAGTLDLDGTTATLVINYTAPASAGTYAHAVKVTNSQGNSVGTTFTTVVVDQLTTTAINVQFDPVITAVDAVRSGSDVTFTATVSDDGPAGELRYLWTFDNAAASFADGTTNPAVLQGYDETIAGIVTLTVTDRNGSGGNTALTYTISAGQFPDTVVVDTPASEPTGTTAEPPTGPVVLAASLNSPQGLAVDGSAIYWAENGTHTIKKMTLASGITTTLTSVGSSIVFAIDANFVYYHSTANCRMDKVGVNGGASSSVVASVGTVGQIVVSGAYAYWTETGALGRISKVNTTTGQETTLASGLNNPSRLAVDGTSVYWTEANAAGAIRKVPINGGAVTTLASSVNPFDIGVDGTSVYWSEPNGNVIKKVPINGGATTMLVGGSSPTYLTVDGTKVYWTDSGAKTMNAVAVAGGAPSLLSSEISYIYGIVTTPTEVIWEVSSNAGSIKKLAK